LNSVFDRSKPNAAGRQRQSDGQRDATANENADGKRAGGDIAQAENDGDHRRRRDQQHRAARRAGNPRPKSLGEGPCGQQVNHRQVDPDERLPHAGRIAPGADHHQNGGNCGAGQESRDRFRRQAVAESWR